MKRYNRILLALLVFFILPGMDKEPLLAQDMNVSLDEIHIITARKSSYSLNHHSVKIDSVLSKVYPGSDLTEVLQGETNLNITRYGGHGSLSSIRIRGSAPTHAQINWNGIPVNGPTTGTADLALISGGMADAVELIYGASGSLFGSGTFGGALNIENKPDWDNRFTIKIYGEAGSWNHLRSGMDLRLGGENWQYHASGMVQSSPNTYSYINAFKQGQPLERRINDTLEMLSGQQHLFLRLPRNWFVQYGSWLFSRRKDLPAPASSSPNRFAAQKDAGTRHFVKINKWFEKNSLELIAARFADTLTYSENLVKNDSLTYLSEIRSSDMYSGFYHRWFISPMLTLENGADLDIQRADAGSYSEPAREIRGAIFGLVRLRIKDISSAASLRKEFNPVNSPKPLFFFNLSYMAGDHVTIKGQLSNKFRLPTLNERYWKPGGNPGLLPETGTGADLGFEWMALKNANRTFKGSLTVFRQEINNWIQWVPSGTYWSPENIRMVICQGAEVDWSGSFLVGKTKWSSMAMYSYTESLDMNRIDVDRRLSRQLAYVPVHQFKMNAGISAGSFESMVAFTLAGRRYTTDNHDDWLILNPYHYLDIRAGYRFDLRRSDLDIILKISNLLNSQYHLIRGYPSPGRSVYLSVVYSFRNTSMKHEKT